MSYNYAYICSSLWSLPLYILSCMASRRACLRWFHICSLCTAITSGMHLQPPHYDTPCTLSPWSPLTPFHLPYIKARCTWSWTESWQIFSDDHDQLLYLDMLIIYIHCVVWVEKISNFWPRGLSMIVKLLFHIIHHWHAVIGTKIPSNNKLLSLMDALIRCIRTLGATRLWQQMNWLLTAYQP